MSCWSTRRRIADYIDGRLRENERCRVEAHLLECTGCSLRAEDIASARRVVTRLPRPVAPANLKTALRVIASHELQSVVASHGSRWKSIWDQWKLRINEFMRPLTIPATGGLLSSLVLFGGLAFTIASNAPM